MFGTVLRAQSQTAFHLQRRGALLLLSRPSSSWNRSACWSPSPSVQPRFSQYRSSSSSSSTGNEDGNTEQDNKKNTESTEEVSGGGGFWETFKRSISQELEKNAELKESFEDLKKATRFGSDSSSSTADAASSAAQQEAQQAESSSTSSDEQQTPTADSAAAEADSVLNTLRRSTSGVGALGAQLGGITSGFGERSREALQKARAQVQETLVSPLLEKWGKVTEQVSEQKKALREQVADVLVKPISKQAQLKEEARRRAEEVRGRVASETSKAAGQVLGQVAEVTRPASEWVGGAKKAMQDTAAVKKAKAAVYRARKSLGHEEERFDRYDPEAGPQGPEGHRQSLVLQQEALWRRQIKELREKVYGNTVYQRLSDTKTQIIESDNPFVQRSLDVADSVVAKASDLGEVVWGETEQAAAMRYLKELIPGFNIYDFIEHLEQNVVQQYLKATAQGDLATVQSMSTEAMYNKAEHFQKELDQKGFTTNLRILDLEEVQLVRAVFDNERPILILSFAVQENREISDKSGEVVEGKNAVQLVHYVWLMTYDDERGWLIADQSIQLSQAII